MIIAMGFIMYLLVFHRRQTIWWEAILPLGVSVILIIICNFFGKLSKTVDTEYGGITL
jgi:hypothetical protein